MLYVVGFGAGGIAYMTLEAKAAIEKSELIAGYTVYAELLKPYFPDKEYITTPMMKEVERCDAAIEAAAGGRTVAMVCSGDSGVYGMASLIYERAQKRLEECGNVPEIEVVAGVTAACSGGAVLGAPISHDFAVISLSDLMTPMEVIEKRITCAAMSDMVICFYNPSSKKRGDYLRRACEIILQHRPEETVCGYVKNIGRDGQTCEVLTLGELKETETDMFTTVYIGSTSTRNLNGKMVTPRGYLSREA